MTINRLMTRLEEMTIGRTTVIDGIVVTRWTETLWEVGTFNKDRMDIQQSVSKILGELGENEND